MLMRTAESLAKHDNLIVNDNNKSSLADHFGFLKARIKKLTDLEKKFRDAFEAFGQPLVEGEIFKVTVTPVSQMKFNITAFKTMHPALYEQFLVPSDTVRVECKNLKRAA